MEVRDDGSNSINKKTDHKYDPRLFNPLYCASRKKKVTGNNAIGNKINFTMKYPTVLFSHEFLYGLDPKQSKRMMKTLYVPVPDPNILMRGEPLGSGYKNAEEIDTEATGATTTSAARGKRGGASALIVATDGMSANKKRSKKSSATSGQEVIYIEEDNYFSLSTTTASTATASASINNCQGAH